MGDDSLVIAIEAILDEAKSLQNITEELKQLQAKVKSYKLKVLAGLDKDASSRQIKNDLAQIAKTKGRVKVVGEMDQAATKKNINSAVKNLKDTEVKLTGVLDAVATQKNVQQQLGQIPKVETTANVNVNGGDEVEKLRNQMTNAGESAAGMASKIYIARSALQLLRRTAIEAKETIIDLDSAVIDLSMATGQNREKTYNLLKDYNKLAGQLGTTTTQVSQAADQWLRQGHSISDTTTLIKDAMVLSKVSQLDSAAATEYLTSAMKGYGIAAQDVISIVDKLSAVDLESATDAGGLAEAMSRTAVTADMAGVSMDRLLGYLAVTGEVTQKSMSSIGESFKTIFSRMNDIKANKLELIDEDGTTEMLSDVELTLKNVGIDLRKTVNEYNNYGDVLDNLAAKWDTLTNVQQNALAKAFAGTRQGENFRALMENYSAAMEYMDIAANSAGTALQKFGVYQDSIEAKSAAFTAAMESLTLDTVDSELVKDLIDAGTAVLEFIEQTGLLKAALISLGAGGVLKGIGLISKGFSTAKQDVLNLGTAINTLRNIDIAGGLSSDIIGSLGKLTKGLNDEQLRLVLSTQQLSTAQMSQILVAGGLSQAEASAKLQTLGLATAQGAATGATWSLSAAVTGLGASIKAAFAMNPIGMIMLAVGVVYELVQGVMALYDAVTVTAEEATEAMEESFSEFEEASNKVKGLNDELQTTQDRIDELEAKDSLTFVEESELQKLRESVKLLQIQADLAEKERVREAKEAADDTVTAYRKNFKDDITIDAVQEYIDSSSVTGNNAILFSDKGNIAAMLAGIEQMRRLRDAVEESSEDYIHFQGIIDGATDSLWEQASVLGTYKSNLEAIPYDELSDDQKVALDEINAAIELIYKELDPAKWNDIQWSSIINDARYTDDIRKLKELASQAEVTANTIKEHFPELAKACEDAGLEIDDVADNLNALSAASDTAAESMGNQEMSTQTLAETLKSLNTVSENVEVISKALGEFSEAGNVSVDTLSGMSDELKNLSNFEDFVDVLSDSASTMEDVQDACNRLAKEYINTTGILDNVNDSNAKLIQTTLEEMGVINAHEIVQARLNAVKLEGVLASRNLSDASWETAKQILTESGASETAITSFKRLRQEQYNAKLAALDLTTATSDTIGALMQQAQAAGAAANSIAALSRLQSLREGGFEPWRQRGLTESNYSAMLESARKAAQIDLSGIGSITVPQVKVSLPKSSSKSKGTPSSKKAVEEYIAVIDQYREAEERLRKVQEERENIESGIDESGDIKKKVSLEKQLISAYQREQEALHNLNNLRDGTITEGVAELRELGFAVEYNADTNELWISNIERLNELTADSKGEYDTLQEATNALRKDTEDLIGTLEDLNKENRDGSSTWLELKGSIRDAKLSIVNDLQEIVDKASDAVDEIQNVSDTLYEAADEFAKNDGFITIDTWQALRKVGMQYMQLLKNENNEWEINEERINAVIAARTRQMAVENAMSYVERIKLATQEGAVENLNDLIFVTTDATNSTWGLVYAELELMHTMGDLNDSQYQAALHNIQAMQDLAENAVQNIGKATDSVEENLEETRKQLEDTKKGLQDLLDELEDMEDGANDLVKYVMDMLKHRIQEQIDLLEEMKDKYSEIIDLKKESLDATKDEQDYQKSIAKKLREMAKLQERINALSLDDSRSAQAERAKLLEEMAELQEDLADTQADKSIEAQKEALDKMEEDYHAEKDEEIKILEDSISSYQKLYDMAIEYIRNNWNTLYSELIAWNTEYGSVLNSEITAAWEAAQAAAQRYGDFVSAIMGSISAEIDSITKQIEDLDSQLDALSTKDSTANSAENKNITVGNKTTYTTQSNEDMVRTIVGRMKEQSAAWGTSSNKDALHQKAVDLAKQLDQYGVHAEFRDSDGTWWITQDKLNPSNIGKLLHSCYHTGGFVGDEPLKPNERYIKAENGELVLTSDQQDSFAAQIDRIGAMTEKFTADAGFLSTPVSALSNIGRGTVSNAITTNNDSRSVVFKQGDVIIQGTVMGPKELAENLNKYIKVTESMVNDFAKRTGMKW